MMAQVVSEQWHRAAGAGPRLHGRRQDGHRPQADDPEHARRRLQGPEGRYHYMATFAGFVPAEQPELSIIVVIDEPTTEYYASDVVGARLLRARPLRACAATTSRRPPCRAQAGRPRGVGVGAAGGRRAGARPDDDASDRGRLTDAPRRAASAPLGAAARPLGAHRRRAPRRSGRRVDILSVTHDSRGCRARHAVLLRARAASRRPRLRRGRRRGRGGRAAVRAAPRPPVPAAARLVGAGRDGPASPPAFHGDPSQRLTVVGVTGTNGKTTVVPPARLDPRGRRAGRAA